jgi:MshEN domain
MGRSEMDFPSQTAAVWFNRCPVCGNVLPPEPSLPACASCRSCRRLLWISPLFDFVLPVANFGERRPDYVASNLPDENAIPQQVLQLIPGTVAREERVIPVAAVHDALVVAVSALLGRDAYDELRSVAKRKIVFEVVVPDDWLDRQIDRFY